MREEKFCWVYILASKPYGTLYVGVTNDIARRVYEHKNDLVPGFTSRYGVHILAWFETYSDIYAAIAREKQIKGWNRDWKLQLIGTMNPNWEDLFPRVIG